MTPAMKLAAALLSIPGLVAESTSAPSAHPSAGPTTVGPTSWHVHYFDLCIGTCSLYDAEWTGEQEYCEVGNCTKPWNNPTHCEPTEYDGRICCQCEAHPSASPSFKPTTEPSAHPSAGPTTVGPTSGHVPYPIPCIGICSLNDADWTGEQEACEVGTCTKPWNNPNHCEQVTPWGELFRLCCQCEAHPSASPSSKPTATAPSPPDCVPDLVESGNCTRPLTSEECSDAANRLEHNWDANPIDPDKPLDHIPGGCFAKRKNGNGGNRRIVKFRYNPHTEPGTNCGQHTKGGTVTKLCVCCA